MTVVTQMLSKQDINDVSKSYSRIKITLSDPKVEVTEPKQLLIFIKNFYLYWVINIIVS